MDMDIHIHVYMYIHVYIYNKYLIEPNTLVDGEMNLFLKKIN